MDQDAVIGRVYREKAQAEEARDVLIAVVRALKLGQMSLDRIEITGAGISVHPAEAQADG